MTEPRLNNRLARQLKAAIRESGLTVYEIAKRAGMAPDSLYLFLNSDKKKRRDIRLATAAAIAEVLGLELTKRDSQTKGRAARV
jgi:hypothetical protein